MSFVQFAKTNHMSKSGVYKVGYILLLHKRPPEGFYRYGFGSKRPQIFKNTKL